MALWIFVSFFNMGFPNCNGPWELSEKLTLLQPHSLNKTFCLMMDIFLLQED